MKKKIGICILTFVVIYVFNFFVPRLIPGDAFSYLEYASAMDSTAALYGENQQRIAMTAYYGMDKPLSEQFINTVKKNFQGDLGESIYYKKNVRKVILSRLPWTLYVMGMTLILSMILGICFAFWGLSKPKVDNSIFGIMTVFAEVPAFLVGIVLLFLVAAKVNFIPLSGGVTGFANYNSLWEHIKDILLHSLMPLSAMIIVTTPTFYFTARTSFLNVLTKRYMVTAKAKGLSQRRISFRYIMLNGITPIWARFFLSVGACLGATLLIENVFAYPGLGKLMRDAVVFRDYPLIQGVFMVSTIMVLCSSLLSDFISDYANRRGHHE